MRATYVGSDYPDLVGETALIRRHRCGLGGEKPMLAQFDSKALGMWSYGWWDFYPEDFVLVSRPHVDSTERARRRAQYPRAWPSRRCNFLSEGLRLRLRDALGYPRSQR